MSGDHRGPWLADRVRQREQVVGLLVKMPSPALVETAGSAGFDLVVIDAEHGVDDHEQLEHHLRAAESAGLATLVRVGHAETSLIGRVLDAGATGVVVPHVTSPGAAADVVRAAHYPPLGRRGLATSTRAGGHTSLSTTAHVEAAARQTVVIGQVEDSEARPLAGDIAATPGLDGVWLGLNDLAMSMGTPPGHPDLVAARDEIAAAVVAAGSACLAVLCDDAEDAAAWADRGANVLLFSSPSLIARTLSQTVDEVMRALPAQNTREPCAGSRTTSTVSDPSRRR